MLSGPIPDIGTSGYDRFDNILSRVLGGISGVISATGNGPTIAGSPTIYGTGAEPAPAADYTPLLIIALIVIAIIAFE